MRVLELTGLMVDVMAVDGVLTEELAAEELRAVVLKELTGLALVEAEDEAGEGYGKR